MLHIIICDDEPIIAKKIGLLVKTKMKELGEKCEIILRNNGKDVLELVKKKSFQLLFLDIDMPDISGIDIASELYEQELNEGVIFVTNHSNLVFETLRYHPFQFVRKEMMETELPTVLENFISRYRRVNQVIEITNDDGTHLLALNSILYVEKQDRRMMIVCENKKSYQVWASLKDFERDYEKNGFCRIHNSILVNFKYVSEIDNEAVILDNKDSLPLSRSKKKFVKERFMEYMRKN